MRGTKGATKPDEMAQLHTAIAKKLRDLIEDGSETTVGGKTRKVPVSAAVLNVVRGFLKDNNIVCDENLPTRAVGELSDSIDKFNEEDDGLPHFTH